MFVHSGPATINGTTVTITGPGTVVLAAVQPGDADYNPSAVVTTSFLVKAMQTLNFPAIGTQTFGEAPFVISPPTSSAGLPVRVTVLSGPARIYGNKVTLTGTGTVVLAANQAGTATVAPGGGSDDELPGAVGDFTEGRWTEVSVQRRDGSFGAGGGLSRRDGCARSLKFRARQPCGVNGCCRQQASWLVMVEKTSLT